MQAANNKGHNVNTQASSHRKIVRLRCILVRFFCGAACLYLFLFRCRFLRFDFCSFFRGFRPPVVVVVQFNPPPPAPHHSVSIKTPILIGSYSLFSHIP